MSPILLPLLTIAPLVAGGPAPAEIRAAVARALPPLLKGAQGYTEQRDCFSCHHQTIPVLALTLAKRRGFDVPDAAIKAQVEFTAESLARDVELYRKGRGQGGGVETAGGALWTLELGEHPGDATTEAVAAYLLDRDKGRDDWRSSSKRPPSEGSPFATVFVATRGIKAYLNPGRKAEAGARLDRARRWLLAAEPKDTEDRVFRLRTLADLGTDPATLASAARDLSSRQAPDGGWSQADGLAPDAYATGSALVALRQSGGMPIDAPAFRRGLAFLIKSQRPDGTWQIKSRSKPFQLYFESGFPHGPDQFISIAASAWATAALALGCP